MTEIKFNSNKHIIVETDHIGLDGLPFRDGIEKIKEIHVAFINKEHPIDIRFTMDVGSYYEDYYPIIKLTGFREKTEDEISVEQKKLERIRNDKYVQYLALKKEFENE